MTFLRPLEGTVLLYDDQPLQERNGVLETMGANEARYMDYTVVAGRGEGFGPGDRVVVSAPAVGKRVVVDGTVYRLVKADDVLAVLEWA